jgi:hypothetical protein
MNTFSQKVILFAKTSFQGRKMATALAYGATAYGMMWYW